MLSNERKIFRCNSEKAHASTREGFLRKSIVAVSFFSKLCKPYS